MIQETNKKNTLRSVRLHLGLTELEVAPQIKITPTKLLEYELNPETLPLKTAIKLLDIYNCRFDMIQFG